MLFRSPGAPVLGPSSSSSFSLGPASIGVPGGGQFPPALRAFGLSSGGPDAPGLHASDHGNGSGNGNGQGNGGNLGTTHHSKPILPHAYVTFGAGVLQKDVDLYTAENPLEGVSGVSGEVEERMVPYHVPSCVSSPCLCARRENRSLII